MKIIIEDIGPEEEEAVIIRCREMVCKCAEAEEGKADGQAGGKNFADRTGRCLLF